MKKYIIKNCPSLNQARNLCNEIINTCCADYNMGKPVVNCQDCTDCLLKRIVEKCKFLINTFDYDRGANYTANEILSMLEIEECER
jgi:hypothetical protein